MISKMKNEKGESVTNRQDIADVFATFYEKLSYREGDFFLVPETCLDVNVWYQHNTGEQP